MFLFQGMAAGAARLADIRRRAGCATARKQQQCSDAAPNLFFLSDDIEYPYRNVM
jgi:hypothetical protein